MFGIDDAAIASFAASAIGGLTGFFGQTSANKQNRDIARDQMRFQERMSNTAWQRGVADMRAAGINPMLAFSQGPASSPVGSSANMQNSAAGVSSALRLLDLSNMRKQGALLDAQKRASDAQALKSIADAQLTYTQDELETYKVPGAKYEAAIDAGKFGEMTRLLNRASPALSSATSLVAKLPSIFSFAAKNAKSLDKVGKLSKKGKDFTIYNNKTGEIVNKF